jgi:hypothetical protein
LRLWRRDRGTGGSFGSERGECNEKAKKKCGGLFFVVVVVVVLALSLSLSTETRKIPHATSTEEI